MFSNNDKISPRQIKRLLIFHLFGISSLLLPPQLAKAGGGAGVWSVLLGMLLAGIYLWMLLISCGRMSQDYLVYLQNGWGAFLSRLFYICYAFVSVFVSGWAAKLLAELVCDQLLENGEFPLALLLIMLLALYGGIAGIESRARIYEIVFWILAVPVAIMLLLCLRQIQTVRWFPFLPGLADGNNAGSGLWQGSIQCFITFLPLTFLLFLKSHEQEEKKTGRSALSALFISGGTAVVIYLVLVGIFGSAALTREQYPIITLMGMVKIPGEFVKRLDAVMIGVWFITLYALIAATLYYGVVITRRTFKAENGQTGGSPEPERSSVRKSNALFWVMSAIVYGIAYELHKRPWLEQQTGRVFYLVGVPFLVLVPLLSLLMCRRQGPKKSGKTQGHAARMDHAGTS